MFVVKCYLHNNGFFIYEAKSIKIFKGSTSTEVHLHFKNEDVFMADVRKLEHMDMKKDDELCYTYFREVIIVREVIIENSNGKTTEIIRAT